MDAAYLRALETRLMWARWAKTQGVETWSQLDDAAGHSIPFWRKSLPNFLYTLEHGDTFFMNRKFCSLVEHARQTIPDDIDYDPTWLQAREGWLWIEEPFSLPEWIQSADDKKLQAVAVEGIKVKVSAIGWRAVPKGERTARGMNTVQQGRIAGEGATQFLCFQSFADYDPLAPGFGCWSYFMIQKGDKLIDRIRQFESMTETQTVSGSGSYVQDRTCDMMHEMRWIYAAFYLMAQRLAVGVPHAQNHAMRKLGKKYQVPSPEIIRVISLRKLEEARKKNPNTAEVDWQWQWTVRGHWRNQYFPSENTHRQIFVETYIKGPEDKPLKPEGHKLFAAIR